MIYLLFLLVSCLYLSYLYKYRPVSIKQLYAYFSPIIIFWVLLIGGQYDVGTDYFSYLDIFNGHLYYIAEHRGEFVFAGIVRICNAIGIYGQGIFFILSFIFIVLLIKIMSYVTDSRYSFIFFFVFIVFSGILHNQMNGIRQYCAVYLFTLAICCFLEKKYKATALLTFLMCFIHLSSFFIIVVFLTGWLLLDRLTQRPKWLYGLVFISLVLSQTLTVATMGGFLNHFSNIDVIDTYSVSYLNTGRITQSGLVVAITKYIYIPLIIYSIHLYRKLNLNDFEKKLFVIGICGYCFKLSIVSIAIINRMGQYFDIMMSIPLIYTLIYLLTKRHILTYRAIMAYLLFPYALKVTVFAAGEYQYHSFFFN